MPVAFIGAIEKNNYSIHPGIKTIIKASEKIVAEVKDTQITVLYYLVAGCWWTIQPNLSDDPTRYEFGVLYHKKNKLEQWVFCVETAPSLEGQKEREYLIGKTGVRDSYPQNLEHRLREYLKSRKENLHSDFFILSPDSLQELQLA